MKPFTLEKKLVVQVRYYESMFVIRDGAGDRIYAGSDEKTANSILTMLNGHPHLRGCLCRLCEAKRIRRRIPKRILKKKRRK